MSATLGDPAGGPRRATSSIEQLIQAFARLPGLGPRSAQRVVLFLLKRRETMLEPLRLALNQAASDIRTCRVCGTLDAADPCCICADAARDATTLCVVEEVADLWAIERTGAFRGRYHVLGGTLSAIEGRYPDDLRIPALVARAQAAEVREVILALSYTVDGQTTRHYLLDALAGTGVTVSGIAHGVPLGGELNYLDEATLSTALRARRGLHAEDAPAEGAPAASAVAPH